MQIDKLRMVVGFSIILAHLVSFAMILLGGALDMDERSELSLIIAPIFAVYVTAIVRRFAGMEQFDRTPVHPALTILAIGTAAIFSVGIPVLVISHEAGNITNFAGLKSAVGIVELALGVYTGAVIDRLFGSTQPIPAASGSAQPQSG